MGTYKKRNIFLATLLIILLFFYVNNHVISYDPNTREQEVLAGENYVNQPGVDIAVGGSDEKPKQENQNSKDPGQLKQAVIKQHPAGEEKNVSYSSKKRGNIDRKTSSRYVLGFYVDEEYGHPGSYDSVISRSQQISAIAPFWYRLSPERGWEIEEYHPSQGFTPEIIKSIVDKAHEENIEVLMLVHNLLYRGQANGKELARQLLASKDTRGAFINSVEDLIKEYGYDGINVDIENIYLDDRDRFSLLVKELYQRLSPQGYKVTVSVPAKTGDNRSNAWSGPFDYEKISQYSHMVAIMTYDEHGYSSGPGPIASYGWVRDAIRYSVTCIPSNKILMGIPGYGFDWKVGNKGPKYLSYSQAMSIANNYGAKIMWDDRGKVPYFKYREGNGQVHEVWFESASSISYKLEIVEEFNLRGIALWRLGLEDPEMWRMLKHMMNVEK